MSRQNAVERLVNWLRTNGGHLHPSIQFSLDNSVDEGNVLAHVAAEAGIEASGQPLVSLPHSLLINCLSVCLSPHSWLNQHTSGSLERTLEFCHALHDCLQTTESPLRLDSSSATVTPASGTAATDSMSSSSSMPGSNVGAADASSRTDVGAQFVLVYIFLMRELDNEGSFWRAYFDALPPPVSGGMTPLTWTSLDLLKGTNLETLVPRMRDALKRQYDALFPSGLSSRLVQLSDAGSDSPWSSVLEQSCFSFERFVLVFELFWSRCLAVPSAGVDALKATSTSAASPSSTSSSGSKNPITVAVLRALGVTDQAIVGSLVPVADLLNHDPKSDVAFASVFSDASEAVALQDFSPSSVSLGVSSSHAEGHASTAGHSAHFQPAVRAHMTAAIESVQSPLFSLCPRRSLMPGSPVTISYGPRSNEILLLHYGFALPESIYSSIAIQLRIDDEARFRAWLETSGAYTSSSSASLTQLRFSITVDEPLPPLLLLAARCGVLTDVELYGHDPSMLFRRSNDTLNFVTSEATPSSFNFQEAFCVPQASLHSSSALANPFPSSSATEPPSGHLKSSTSSLGRPNVPLGYFSLANETAALRQLKTLFESRLARLAHVNSDADRQLALSLLQSSAFPTENSKCAVGTDQAHNFSSEEEKRRVIAALLYRSEQRALLEHAQRRLVQLRAEFHGSPQLHSATSLDSLRLSIFGHLPSRSTDSAGSSGTASEHSSSTLIGAYLSPKVTSFPLGGAMHAFTSPANRRVSAAAPSVFVALAEVEPDEAILRLPIDKVIRLETMCTTPSLFLAPQEHQDLADVSNRLQSLFEQMLVAGFDEVDFYSLWVMSAGEWLATSNFGHAGLAGRWNIQWLQPLMSYPGPAVAWPATLTDPKPVPTSGFDDGAASSDTRFAVFAIEDQKSSASAECAPSQMLCNEWAEGRSAALEHLASLIKCLFETGARVGLPQFCQVLSQVHSSLMSSSQMSPQDAAASNLAALRRYAWASAIVESRLFDTPVPDGSRAETWLLPLSVVPAPYPGTAAEYALVSNSAPSSSSSSSSALPVVELRCPGGLKKGGVVCNCPGSVSNADLLLRTGCSMRRLGADPVMLVTQQQEASTAEELEANNRRTSLLSHCGVGFMHLLTPDHPLPARLLAACRLLVSDASEIAKVEQHLQIQQQVTLRKQQAWKLAADAIGPTNTVAFTALSVDVEWRRLALVRQLLDALWNDGGAATPPILGGQLATTLAQSVERHSLIKEAIRADLQVLEKQDNDAVTDKESSSLAGAHGFLAASLADCRKALAAARFATRGTLAAARRQLEVIAEALEAQLGSPSVDQANSWQFVESVDMDEGPAADETDNDFIEWFSIKKRRS